MKIGALGQRLSRSWDKSPLVRPICRLFVTDTVGQWSPKANIMTEARQNMGAPSLYTACTSGALPASFYFLQPLLLFLLCPATPASGCGTAACLLTARFIPSSWFPAPPSPPPCCPLGLQSFHLSTLPRRWPSHSLSHRFPDTLHFLIFQCNPSVSLLQVRYFPSTAQETREKGKKNYKGTALLGFNHILSWWLLFSRLTGL